MGCISMPQIPMPPDLGFGLSISVPLPSFEFDLTLCCKILAISIVPPPLPLFAIGIAIPPGVMELISTNIKAVQAFIDALPPTCPKEF